MSRLFIYIPTYKRPQLLRRQLEAIKVSAASNRLRVLVSNNDPGSAEFSDIAAAYSGEGSAFEFRENPANIGGNANILLGFMFCQADEFLWILSDDDTLVAGAVDVLLPSLDSGADLVHLGAYPGYGSETIGLRDLFRTDRGPGFGLISTVIYRFSFVGAHIARAFDYIESSFPHLAVSLSALRDVGSARLAVVPSSKIFVGDGSLADGDYSVAYAGFGYLADFLEPAERASFVWRWFTGSWLDYFLARDRTKSDLGKTRFAKSSGYIGSFGAHFRMVFAATELLYSIRKLSIGFLRRLGITRKAVGAPRSK